MISALITTGERCRLWYPGDWIGSHGWHVIGTDEGSEWVHVNQTILEIAGLKPADRKPKAAWFRTRKGRGYLKYDNASHGSPHKTDSELFWETKKPFIEKYGAEFQNYLGEPPADEAGLMAEFRANLSAVMDVLKADQDLLISSLIVWLNSAIGFRRHWTHSN